MRPMERGDKRQDGLEEWGDIISMHLVAHCSVSFRPLLSYRSNYHHRHDLKVLKRQGSVKKLRY